MRVVPDFIPGHTDLPFPVTGLGEAQAEVQAGMDAVLQAEVKGLSVRAEPVAEDSGCVRAHIAVLATAVGVDPLQDPGILGLEVCVF